MLHVVTMETLANAWEPWGQTALRIVPNWGEGAPTWPVGIGCQYPTEQGLALGNQPHPAKDKSVTAQ